MKLKMGILGCGRISNCHITAITNNSDAMELSSVCDINPTNLERVVGETGATGYSSIEEMLNGNPLDCVAVCTPNGFHYENAKKVLEAGINVIVEKPLTLNYAEGEELFKLAKEKGKQIFLIHQNRLNPTIECVKKAIDSGAFGKIYMMTSNVFWFRDEDYYKNPSWHGTKNIDGGAFMTQASHYTDIMHWFSESELKSVYAMGKTMERPIETEDCGSAVLEWKNDIIGNVNLSVLTYNENFEGSITIIGQKGLVKIGGTALNKIVEWKFHEEVESFCETSYDTDSVYGFGHIPYYKSVADCLLNGKSPLLSNEDALGSLKLLCAITDSMDKKEVIKF